MIYYTGTGANLIVNLAKVSPKDGLHGAIQLMSGSVAPYAPAISAHQGRIAAAWTQRREARVLQIKILLFGVVPPSP